MARFHQAVRACWRWSLLTSTLISGSYVLAAPIMFPLFTPHPPVLAQLQIYLPWLVLMPLAAAPSYLLDGVFIGAARSRYMMHSMVICLALVYLPLWYLLQDMGNNGLWLAFTAFNAARGITLYWYFHHLGRRGLWLD